MLNKAHTKVLYKVLANPVKTAEHHQITHERWILGQDYEGKRVIQMEYLSDSEELWVLLEDGEELEVRNIVRKQYKPIELLDAKSRELYIRQGDIQETETLTEE